MPLLPRLYNRRIAGSIIVQTTIILALIEAIFLAERFTSILRSAIDKHARFTDVLLELACTTPDIFGLALPIAVMFGVYRVTLRCREDREFLVIAGTGSGVRQLLRLIAGVALSAQALSLVVSGAIQPMTRFAGRAVLFNAEYRAIRGGISLGQFYYFPSHMVFAGAQTVTTPARRLFIHETGKDSTDRVITADHVDIVGPSAGGTLALQIRDFTAYEFAKNPGLGGETDVDPGKDTTDTASPAGPATTMHVRDYAQEVALDEMLPFEPRGKSIDHAQLAPESAAAEEWTLFELLGLTTRPASVGTNEVRALGGRVARSLLCLIAPLVALLALAQTTRATQAFAFPVACVGLMCLDLTQTAVVRGLAPGGPWLVAAALFGLTAAIIAGLLKAIVHVQQDLVRPALARA